jgi:hypothetical protein
MTAGTRGHEGKRLSKRPCRFPFVGFSAMHKPADHQKIKRDSGKKAQVHTRDIWFSFVNFPAE